MRALVFLTTTAVATCGACALAAANEAPPDPVNAASAPDVAKPAPLEVPEAAPAPELLGWVKCEQRDLTGAALEECLAAENALLDSGAGALEAIEAKRTAEATLAGAIDQRRRGIIGSLVGWTGRTIVNAGCQVRRIPGWPPPCRRGERAQT